MRRRGQLTSSQHGSDPPFDHGQRQPETPRPDYAMDLCSLEINSAPCSAI